MASTLIRLLDLAPHTRLSKRGSDPSYLRHFDAYLRLKEEAIDTG
jgi:hypothetical protein